MRRKNKQQMHWILLCLFILVALILAIPSNTYAPHNNYIVLQLFHKNNYIAIATGVTMLTWIALWFWQTYCIKDNSSKSQSKKSSLQIKNKSISDAAKLRSYIFNPQVISLVSLSWFAVLGWASLSYFWSENSGHFLEKAVFIWAAAFIFYLIQIIIQDERYRQWLLYSLIIAAVGVSIYGIAQYTFGFSKIIGRASPSSTFGNRNVSSHIIVLVLPLMFYLLVGKKHQSITQTAILLFCSMLMFTYLFVTTARGPWGSAFIATVLFIIASLVLKKQKIGDSSNSPIWQNISKKSITLLFVFIAMGALLTCLKHDKSSNQIAFVNPLSTVQKNISESLNSGKSNKNSTSKRIITWQTIGVEAFNDSPILGHGIGSFHYIAEKYFTKYAKGMYSLHNDHFQFAVELGLVGALLILIAILCTLYAITKLIFSKNVPRSDKLLVIALLSSLAATAFNSFFSFPYQHAVPTVTLAALLAYINFLYIKYLKITAKKEEYQEKQYKKPLITTVALALCIPFALLIIIIPLHWNSIYWTFEKQLAEKRWTNIEYKEYSYNRYVRSMLRTTMRSYGKRKLDRQRVRAAQNFLAYFPHSEGLSSWAATVARKKKDYKTAAELYEMAAKYAPKGDITALKHFDAINRYYLKTPEKTLPLIEATLERHSIEDLKTHKDNFLEIGKMYQYLNLKAKALEMYQLGKQYFPTNAKYQKQINVLEK